MALPPAAVRTRSRVYFIPENESPFGAGGHHIRRTIAIEILHHKLRADARAVMNQLRHELRPALGFGIANGPVPIQDSGSMRIRIEVTFKVREESFSGNQVGDAVAIHVGERYAVRFGEGDAAGVFGAEVAHDVVAHERDILLR